MIGGLIDIMRERERGGGRESIKTKSIFMSLLPPMYRMKRGDMDFFLQINQSLNSKQALDSSRGSL